MDQNQIGCWDSVLLENESESCFISNLNLRFKRDNIYVRMKTISIVGERDRGRKKEGGGVSNKNNNIRNSNLPSSSSTAAATAIFVRVPTIVSH